jgi:tetratricopeptide (TPR) repeat protein
MDFVKVWLTNSPEEWLLFLDNADDPSLNILSYVPVGSRGTIIITTRNPELTALETVGSYEFAGMDHDEASTLLLRISKIDEESEEATEMASSIANTLGCLALAITQAGAAIRQKHCTITEYCEMYTRHRRDLLNLKHSPAVTDYQYTVYATWELSVTMIQSVNDETSRHALDLLRVFSFMHFANISEETFRRACTNLNSYTWSEWTAAHQLPWLVKGHSQVWNPSLYRNALTRLSSFSLITRDHSNTISMHPLVHAWAKDRLDESDNIKWSAAVASILGMSIQAQNWDLDSKYRRSIISHIVSSLPYVLSKFITEDDGVEGRLKMVDCFAEALLENHLLQESAILREKVLDASRVVYGADSLKNFWFIEGLMRSFCALGRYEEVVDVMEDVLRKRDVLLLDKQHLNIRCIKNRLSIALFALGRYTETLNMQLGILEAKESTFEEDPEMFQSLKILADCYRACGRPKEALSVAQKLLSCRRRTHGEEHPRVLEAMDIVAFSYCESGRFQEACELGESVLNVRLRTLGEESEAALY